MLSCECYCDNNYYFYYDAPIDFAEFDKWRRKRCVSCAKLINYSALCLEFHRYRDSRGDYEENRFGDTVEMASKFMCEKCGEIYLNLNALGYCHILGGDIREDLYDYWELTGWRPSADSK